ncbi:MAG: hypothetical protein ABL883_01890 [Terricaulis sp.]
MKRLCVIAALALSACNGGPSGLRGDRLDWRCDQGTAFSIRINAQARQAEVFAAGRIYRLDFVETGYSNGEVRYYEQSGVASLVGAFGGPYNNCREG